MKALILAAGMGQRLRDRTSDRSKAMVEVAGITLIERVFDFLDHSAVTKIGVVGGYKHEMLFSHINALRTDLQTFFNPNFVEGSVRTIITARDFLDDDFLLMNADHIYPKEMIPSVIRQLNGITTICDFDRKLVADDMKIKKNASGKLIKIRKDLTDFDGGYIGMTFVPKSMLNAYKEAMFATYEIYGSASPVEFILGHMAANGHEISIADLSGFGWLEVDTKEDLLNAEKTLLR